MALMGRGVRNVSRTNCSSAAVSWIGVLADRWFTACVEVPGFSLGDRRVPMRWIRFCFFIGFGSCGIVVAWGTLGTLVVCACGGSTTLGSLSGGFLLKRVCMS